MKRLLPLFWILLLLLLGCEMDVTQGTEYNDPEESWYGIGADWSVSGSDVKDPMLAQSGSVVKTILSYQGEVPMTAPVRTFSYQLPMIDLQGAQAQGCNQEIETRFGTLIRQSMDAMARYEDPILERLSFTSYTHSGILTLRVDRLDYDGEDGRAFYTVNAETGEAVGVEELFAAAGISGIPETVINEAIQALYTARYGSLTGADASVTTALNRTEAALAPLSSNRMHLTPEGKLIVAFELFEPNGGSSVEELNLP